MQWTGHTSRLDIVGVAAPQFLLSDNEVRPGQTGPNTSPLIIILPWVFINSLPVSVSTLTNEGVVIIQRGEIFPSVGSLLAETDITGGIFT